MRLRRAGKGKINLLWKAGAKRKKKKNRRLFWPLYSDPFWGHGRTEPNTCRGTSRKVTSLISDFTGWLRRQNTGTAHAASQGGAAHKMRCFGVYSRWPSGSQRPPPTVFFLDRSPTLDIFALYDNIPLNILSHSSLNHGWPPDLLDQSDSLALPFRIRT